MDDSSLTNNADTDLTLWTNQAYTNIVNTLDAGSLRMWIGDAQNGSNFANETATPMTRQIGFSATGGQYPSQGGGGPYPVSRDLESI